MTVGAVVVASPRESATTPAEAVAMMRTPGIEPSTSAVEDQTEVFAPKVFRVQPVGTDVALAAPVPLVPVVPANSEMVPTIEPEKPERSQGGEKMTRPRMASRTAKP